MEVKALLILLRRWAWLLIIGILIGGASAYFISQRQEPVYQATTKLLVIQPQESSVTADINFTDQELIQTYIALLITQPVLDSASDTLGFRVNRSQISGRQASGTRLLEVTAQANDPENAALIANTLVDVLIEQNNNLQSGRFASSEESLQAQIAQVEAQINDLRAITPGRTAEEIEAQRALLEADIIAMRTDLFTLQLEIDNLTAPLLSPEQQSLLLDKRIELANLRFDQTVAQSAYTGLLALNPTARNEATEQSLRDFNAQILRLEEEIKGIQATTLADAPETQALVAEKQAEKEQNQLDLEVAKEQYFNLLGFGDTEGSNAQTGTEQQSTTLSLYQQLYSNLLSTYESVRLARLQNTPDLVQVELAAVPAIPIQPRPLQNTLLGAAVGLLIMGGIAFLIEYLDDTLKTPGDVSQIFGAPVIGFIADTQKGGNGTERVTVIEEPRSPVAEAFRALRTNLEFADVDNPLRTILVTSPNPSDGKSTVAANLAAIMAQGGNRVFLIDLDLRRPRLHRFLDIPNRLGVCDVFLGRETVQAVTVLSEKIPDLFVMPTGNLPANPSELLGSEKMLGILDEAKSMANVVIIDSPPFIVSDPSVLAARVDGVLIVLQPGGTSAGVARAMVEQLERANARIVGVVMNRISGRGGMSYYGGYQYYYAPYYRTGHYDLDKVGKNGARQKSGRLPQFLGRFRNAKSAE